MLLDETLRTTTSLSDGTSIEIEIKNIDFTPPVGDDPGGRVTADVTATIPAADPPIIANRDFDRKVYDGEPDDDHVHENDWQAWYGNGEMIDHPLQRQFERRVSGAVSQAIGELRELHEGCLAEDDIEAVIAHAGLDARLIADPSDCRWWRLDITTYRADSFWTDSQRFVSLRQAAEFIATVRVENDD